MQEALDQIDTSPLEALARLKQDIDVLDGRLASMDERRSSVAEAVYLRVRDDYQSRRAALETQAEPLRTQAREQYAKLRLLLTRAEQEHETTRLDHEEIEFRFALGEFDETEYKRLIAAVDEQLEARAKYKQQAEALRARFVDAFRSEQELEQAPAPAAAPEGTTQRFPVLPETTTGQMRRPTPFEAAAETRVMRVLNSLEPGPVRADQTVMLRAARLVPQNPEAGRDPHALSLKPTAIGSDAACEIRIKGPGVTPRHAEVRVSMAGFTLVDLGGGARVNGVVIDEHLLRHEDVVQIGPARFVFREG